ncbi:MAG TPA: hypothetical protein VL854_11490 [Nitrososphaeraceae archaeon]|nr:hypothetical protein [Nitrososphaeraceae archaeon]
MEPDFIPLEDVEGPVIEFHCPCCIHKPGQIEIINAKEKETVKTPEEKMVILE